MMDETQELHRRTDKNVISIRDTSGDIDLEHGKWNFLFDFVIAHTTACYFCGFHINYFDAELPRIVNFLSGSAFLGTSAAYSNVFFQVKTEHLVADRNVLSVLFDHYEQPYLMFVDEGKNKNDLLLTLSTGLTPNAVTKMMDEKGMYTLFISYQQDVLWVRKSADMPDIAM